MSMGDSTAAAPGCRVPFLVTAATSEDDMHPALHLQVRDRSCPGWQSTKLCEYPQEVVLMVNHGTPVHIATMQVLVHHTKIPSRIDIFVAESAVTKLRKLGYVALDSNESSNFNARELKCITIDCAVAYFKLSLHQCHRNRFNVFDQVGLVDITLLGSPAKASDTTTSLPSLNPIMHLPNNNNHPASNSPRTQCDTASLELYHIPHPSRPGTRLSLRQLVEALRIQRATCVDAEDYAAAKHTKDLERTVLQCLAQLERLHLQKNSVLQVENYDGASLVKAEMDVVIAQVCAVAAQATALSPLVPQESKSSSPKTRREHKCRSPPKVDLMKATALATSRQANDDQLAEEPSEPEHLEPKLAAACEGVGGILTRIDGRTFCCAYSRHRTLREPATAAIVHAIQTLGHFSQNGSSTSALEKLVLPWLTTGILQQPVHAFASGCTFVVVAITSCAAVADQLEVFLPPLVTIFIQRLGDPSSKVRNNTGVAMLEIARSVVGPRPVLACVLAFIQSVRTVDWRLLYGLVRAITALLEAYECPVEPFDIATIVTFIAAQNGFDHAMTQVTEVATQFAVALYQNLGPDKADTLLACVPASQRATYKQIVVDDEWHHAG